MFNLKYRFPTLQGQKTCDEFFQATFQDHCIQWTILYGANLSIRTFNLRICHVILEILRLNRLEEYNIKDVPFIAYIVSETKDYYLYANKISRLSLADVRKMSSIQSSAIRRILKRTLQSEDDCPSLWQHLDPLAFRTLCSDFLDNNAGEDKILSSLKLYRVIFADVLDKLIFSGEESEETVRLGCVLIKERMDFYEALAKSVFTMQNAG